MGYAIQRDDIVKILADGGDIEDVADAILARVRELDSCYGNAAADEPIFVLKATDDLAPDIVDRWVYSAQVYLPHESRRRQAADEASACAERMRRWKEAHPDA